MDEKEQAIMNEAFMIGRIYATNGEKESPADIHKKLIEKCELVSNSVDARVSQPSEPSFGQWIKVTERLPTKDDADEFGNILLYRETNEGQKQLSKSIYNWQMVKYCDEKTYWTKLQLLPKP